MGSGAGAHNPEWFRWHCSKEEEGEEGTQTLFWSGAAPTIQTVSLRDGACFQTSP